jgi:DNA mismatch endonuclease (patch repair protein)
MADVKHGDLGCAPEPRPFRLPFLLAMADNLTPQQRSAFMSRIRGKDTKPELAVRKALHALRYRFRLHVKGLVGRPDIAFTRKRKVVFVHGCF